MVARELLDELKSVGQNFDWTYDGRTRKIRGKLKSAFNNNVLLDPIGAVCYLRTGLLFEDDNWFQAAEEIGLSHIDAGDLIAAANNISNQQSLRRQIIDNISLEPEQA